VIIFRVAASFVLMNRVLELNGRIHWALGDARTAPSCTGRHLESDTRSEHRGLRLELGVSKKFPLSCGLSRSDVLAAAVVACFVGILGLWPHLSFAREIGEFRYFHGAHDEDIYTLGWLSGTLRSTRALSGLALSVVYALCSSSLDATLVISDFIFPFLATCAAYFAASQLVSSRPGRILTALLLVFANDLFSLGNLALWTSSNILGFTQAIDMIGPNLVPPYVTSFLAIFRTPEPQVSFSLMFLNLGLLARFATIDKDRGPAAFAVAIVALSLLPIGYTFVTFPIAAIAGASVIVFAFFRKGAAATVAIGLLAAMLVSLGVYYWNQKGDQTVAGLATHLLYHTRAPIITPAVIGSLIFGTSFGIWMILGRRWQPLAFLALACLLMPAMLSNQQIITGIMFSARDWERTVNYPVLVFGIVAALSVIAPLQEKRPHLLSPLCWAWCAVILLAVWRGQQSSFGYWKSDNLESIAIIRALKAVDPGTLDRASLVFQNAGIAPLVQVRMKNQLNPALTYYRVGLNFVPNMAPDANSASPSPYEDSVFEHWFRTGVSPEKAEQLLHSEAQQRWGPYLGFLFSFRDGWFPASDNRAMRQQEVEQSIGPIIGRYRNYLVSQIRHDFDRPALLVSAQSPAELRSPPGIHNEYIGMGSAGGAVAYVYRQSPP